MMRELLAQLTELVEKVTGHESVEQAEPTQLRLAVHRLGMFAEHLDQLIAASVEEPGMLSRKDLNTQALEAGVEAPGKMPNKQAVLAAIQAAEAQAPTEETQEPVEPTEGAEVEADAGTAPTASSRI
jgi:hypothetical protein